MITFSRAQFSVHSTTRDAADVTDALGIEPSDVVERGRIEYADGFRDQAVSIWSLWPPLDLDDPTGTDVLRWVVDALDGTVDALAALGPDFEFDLSWWGTKADWRENVTLPADLAARIAALGLDLQIDFSAEPAAR